MDVESVHSARPCMFNACVIPCVLFQHAILFGVFMMFVCCCMSLTVRQGDVECICSGCCCVGAATEVAMRIMCSSACVHMLAWGKVGRLCLLAFFMKETQQVARLRMLFTWLLFYMAEPKPYCGGVGTSALYAVCLTSAYA